METKVNYQLIKAFDNGRYYPDYQAFLAAASCQEEREYIERIKDKNISFSFNMVYVTKQACSHYEIFQTPCNEFYPLESLLARIGDESSRRRCTSCICRTQSYSGGDIQHFPIL